MATVNARKSFNVVEHGQPAGSDYFNPSERQWMKQEDSTALTTVSLELLAIVCLGFVLVGATVGAILLRS